jgi:hypothetical protein
MKIIAEVRTRNFAWGKVDEGIIITNDGYVHKYNMAKFNKPSSEKQRLEQSVEINKIDNKLLRQIITLSKNLYGNNAVLKHKMFDAGTTTYIIYDNMNNAWEIFQEGDMSGSVKGSEQLIKILYDIKNTPNTQPITRPNITPISNESFCILL